MRYRCSLPPARLRYLTHAWAERLRALPNVRFNTALDGKQSCAIANVRIEGVDTGKLAAHLMDKHKIFVVPILHDEFEGLRVTPNVYTTMDELDRFVDAMTSVAKNGLS